MRKMEKIKIYHVCHWKRKWILFALAGAAALVLAIVLLVLHPWSGAEPYSQNRPEVDEVLGVPLSVQYISPEIDNRPGTLRQIKYIVIHETANHSEGADAQAHADYLAAGGDAETSWHYTVDDHQIVQHIPDNEVSWNAGDKLRENGGNLNGISIELCVNDDGDFEKTFDNGARLTAYLLSCYDLDTGAVLQHFNFNGKNCPMTIRETGRWDEFIQLVEQYLEEVE